MAQRPALGKGLGALLGDIDAAPVAQEARIATVTVAADSPVAVNEIALDKIVPNPFQPRSSPAATSMKRPWPNSASPSGPWVSSSR